MIDKFDGRWRFLSNFYPVKITHKGIVFPSVEHYYVSMKIDGPQHINVNGKLILLGVNDAREFVASITTPGQVKRLGRTLDIRKDWDEVKFDIMLWGVRQKFKDQELQGMLLSTKEEELIEGTTWHDQYWGVCTCPKHRGEGLNNLGKILMLVRDEVKSHYKTSI